MLNKYLSVIANTIRSLLGTTEKINAQDFSNKITEVYEAGKADIAEAFWEEYQKGGMRDSYMYAFAGTGWYDDIYTPLYDFFDIKYSLNMYAHSFITDTKREFYFAETKTVSNLFEEAQHLKTVRTLHTNAAVTYTDWFLGALKLENISFEGEIGNDIDFKPCTALSKASIESIIGCLSKGVTGKTLTLSKTAVDNAFETDAGAADGSESEEWGKLISGISDYWSIALYER